MSGKTNKKKKKKREHVNLANQSSKPNLKVVKHKRENNLVNCYKSIYSHQKFLT